MTRAEIDDMVQAGIINEGLLLLDGFDEAIIGLHYQRFDHPSCVVYSADRILAGTLRGVCVGDGSSAWQRLGPRLLVSAIAAHPSAEGPWLAGATPGGLWRSDDGGRRWGQIDGFDTVRVILPPEAAP